MTVDYAVAHGTTSAGDFSGSLSGTVTFDPGDTSKLVQLQSINDALDEADSETFTVNLSNSSNATIADGSGTGSLDRRRPDAGRLDR